MNVVRCIERLFDRAVGIEKIVGQIEDLHFRVTVDLQWIEGIVGLFDVFVEGFSGCMARQDLRQDDVRLGELVSDVGHTHLYPFGGSFDARLRREEHVVVADHHNNQARFEAFDAAVIEPPQYVLRFIAADADIDRLIISKMLLPCVIEGPLIERTAPLLGDAVADEKDVDGPLVRLHVAHQFRMGI